MTSEQGAETPSTRVLQRQYRIDEKLGEGGPSVVYRGLDLLMEIPIAIKKLKRDAENQLNDTSRFLREARTQAKLVHENIVSIRAILEDEGEHFIIMELIEGETLEALIQQSDSQPRLAIAQLVDLGCQTLMGLEHAHSKNVLHRDIKPANIMCTPQGMVKLADFGIAREIHDQRLTKTGSIIGTPAYMSPEQIRAQDTDHRTDIYSMGMTLYEAVSGHTAFENPAYERPDLFEMLRRHTMEAPLPLRTLGIDIPPALDAAILKSLAKSPADRFPNCLAFVDALKQSLDPQAASLLATAERPAGSTRSIKGPLPTAAPMPTVAPKVEEVMDVTEVQSEGQAPQPGASASPGKGVGQLAWSLLAGLGRGTKALVKAAHRGWKEADGPRRKLIVVAGIGVISLLANLLFLLRPNTPAPGLSKQPARTAQLHSQPPKQFPSQPPKQPPSPATQRPKSTATPPRTPHPHAPNSAHQPPRVPPRLPPQPAPRAVAAGKPPADVKWGADMVKIPKGHFYQGTNAPGGKAASPQRHIYLDEYWIDRYEVTTAQYLKCIAAGGCRRLLYRYFFRTMDHTKGKPLGAPISYTRWEDAVSFCKWANKRLPTEAEWEKAARGTDKRLYPWGNHPPNCTMARYSRCGRRGLEHYNPKSRAAGKSPYGVFDMAGGVWEWVQDCYDSNAYRTLPTHNPRLYKLRCSRHVVRGGGFYTGKTRKLQTFYRGTGGRRREIVHGFRCAWSPKHRANVPPGSPQR